ncbi:MAG TPA: lytic transglycosylase domain-containing protein [Acetobacteraceae bacterium]|jgi:hypothetical protein|nr:lytic transglycosylase domain-containing protein [Acetobacteraceae bacterium]
MAELAQRGGSHEADEQSQDHDDHQQFEQREAALTPARGHAMSIPLLACMAAVASFYHLPPRVLPSIQAVEGGSLGTVHANTDGSQDLGIMQINTRWVLPLGMVTHLPVGTVRIRLLHDGCFNIAAAGAILRGYLNEAHGNLLLAIGYYHSHTPTLNRTYQTKVITSAYRLFDTNGRVALPTVRSPERK